MPARWVRDVNPPYVEWKIDRRTPIEPNSPRVAAFLEDLKQKVSDARAAMQILKSAEQVVNSKVRLPREDYNKVAHRLGMKQADGVTHVLVDQARLNLAYDVLRKTVETVEPLLNSDEHVVEDSGELKLVGWGVYRVSGDAEEKPRVPKPLLAYRVQGVGDDAALVLTWTPDPVFTDGYRLERRNPADGKWSQIGDTINREMTFVQLPFEGPRHTAQYRLFTSGPLGHVYSDPLLVNEPRPAAPVVAPEPVVAMPPVEPAPGLLGAHDPHLADEHGADHVAGSDASLAAANADGSREEGTGEPASPAPKCA